MAFELDSAIPEGNELEEHLNYLLYSPEKHVLKREHSIEGTLEGDYLEQEPWIKKLKAEDEKARPSEHAEPQLQEVLKEQKQKTAPETLNSFYKGATSDEPLLSEIASNPCMRKTFETNPDIQKIEKVLADLLKGEDQEISLQQLAIRLSSPKYEKYHGLFPEEVLKEPAELCDRLKEVILNSVQTSMESGKQPFFQLRQAINGNFAVSTIHTTPLYSQNISDSTSAFLQEASILSNSVPAPESVSLEGPFQWFENNQKMNLNDSIEEDGGGFIENPFGMLEEEESQSFRDHGVNITNFNREYGTTPLNVEGESWSQKSFASYSGENDLPSVEDLGTSDSLPPLFDS
ncbi:hypothetical protein SPOG_00350 [Schizosaccharomyces cryophilus OY26]|uniref:Uncharacterized protein n=1 Tax=Schizosaccharomyces cryophilus (strain OY26 / ATCC MYA-4695 / CBS 11777 / NBRC 106824 / NRRL Y48691) TaxID=653667 RepID=S9VWC2_SCHCR|nr:uncharacterized protein SPOG_00350 [Schizosaccharomyces cryophilus OY26]EPY51928.1 hypothetical protein SPOG_00350 [Schizosaccharomyces cryophilus OY26]